MAAKRDNSKQSRNTTVGEYNDLTTALDDVNSREVNGSSLLQFLVEGAFASLFPFLPVFLSKKGFSISQIGTLLGVSFLVSGLCSPIFYRVSEKFRAKKWIMKLSILSWVVFLLPLAFVTFSEMPRHCPLVKYNGTQVTVSYNQTDLTKREPINLAESTNSNRVLAKQARPSDESDETSPWNRLIVPFGIYLCVMAIGRIFQSSTDYFYSRHMFSLRVTENFLRSREKGSRDQTNNLFLATITGSLMAVCCGAILDHVAECDEYFGHFRSCFYFWAIMLLFTAMILHFQGLPDIDLKFSSANTPRKELRFAKSSSQKATLCLLCFMFGLLKGLSLSFLGLQIYLSHGLFLVIGASYVVEKFSEAIIDYLKLSVLKGIHITQGGLIFACVEFFRHIFLSFVTTRFMTWFVIPVQLLSGFSLLITSSSEMFQPFRPSPQSGTSLGWCYFLYWCVGLPTGTLGAGFAAERYTLPTLFKASALSYMCLSFLIAFILLLWKVESKEDVADGENVSEDDSMSFLREAFTNGVDPNESSCEAKPLYETVEEKIQD